MTELILSRVLFFKTLRSVGSLKLLWPLRCLVMLVKNTWKSMELSLSTSLKLLRRTIDTVLTTPTLNSEIFTLLNKSWHLLKFLNLSLNFNAVLLLMVLPLLLSAVKPTSWNITFKTKLLRSLELTSKPISNLLFQLVPSTSSEERCPTPLLSLFTNNLVLVLKMYRFVNYMTVSLLMSFVLMRLLDFAPSVLLERPSITTNSPMVVVL